MKSTFHLFVEKIVQQTDGNQDEKDDLHEELLTHMELSREQLIKEGFSGREAERKAMENFGDEKVIGKQIQQAMFPYRKEMLLTLAFMSIVSSFGVYSSQLFIEGDAYIVWLVLSVFVSSCVLIFSLQPMPFLNRRIWVNSMLLIHIFTYLFGTLLAASVDATISTVLTLLSGCIVLLAIVLIYRTTIYDYQSGKQILKKQAMILHVLNITAGILIVGATLFFLWGFLAFGGEGLRPAMLGFLVPLLVWVISYIAQMHLLSEENKKSAYAIAVAPLLIILVLVVSLFWVV